MAADAELAAAELNGLLGAFAWVNGKTNHGYTFTFTRLPAAASVADAVRLAVADPDTPTARVGLSLTRLRGWRTPVARTLQQWLFGFRTDRVGGTLRDPADTFTLSAPWGKRAAVAWVMTVLDRAVTPTAVWRVDVDVDRHYECGWEDLAFETADGVYLLHLGVSD